MPKSVPEAAKSRNLFYLDATCPLVSKVHVEAERQFGEGREILLIGHAGHPEVIGTMGQLPDGAVHLIETADDARAFTPRDPDKLGGDHADHALGRRHHRRSSSVLRDRFPRMITPRKDDICYATTNRQEAVKRIAPACDCMIVVGAPNSSNSLRLVEVAERAGCAYAVLIQRAAEIDWDAFSGIRRLGVTAGASAPEVLVDEIIDAFRRATRRRWKPSPRRKKASLSSCRASSERWPALIHMAVYTDVSDEELEAFIGSYAIGALTVLQGHRRGRRELELSAPHRRRALHPHALREARDARGPAVFPRR